MCDQTIIKGFEVWYWNVAKFNKNKYNKQFAHCW